MKKIYHAPDVEIVRLYISHDVLSVSSSSQNPEIDNPDIPVIEEEIED